jgi:galactonate dehydratase
MRIIRVDDLHCAAGWRNFSFLKVTTDSGLVGWSEYNESYGNRGLTEVIRGLVPRILGRDARRVEAISAMLYAATRQVAGGMIQQAIGAIENALLDIKAKGLGVPVYEMLGGPIRETIPVYWSHCGSYRVNYADVLGTPAIKTRADLVALGIEVRQRGFGALKCNVLRLDAEPPFMWQPGFTWSPGYPELNLEPGLAERIADQIAALREGLGPDRHIFLDLNFNLKTEGFIGVGRALDNAGLGWLELDSFDPVALAAIRRSVSMPIASGESLFGRRQYRPFFEAGAIDIAIVDVPWNGLLESLKIASMAEAYEVNVAPHNFYGPLASLMSAHFCALTPNLRIMEIEVDDVPWARDLVATPPIEAGQMGVPTRPGWGGDIDEAVVAAHPATR